MTMIRVTPQSDIYVPTSMKSLLVLIADVREYTLNDQATNIGIEMMAISLPICIHLPRVVT